MRRSSYFSNTQHNPPLTLTLSVPFAQPANTLKKQLAALAEFAREVQRRDNELRGLARLAASDIEHNVSTAEQMLNHADERLKKFKLRSLDADSGRFLETNQAMIASAVELLAAVRQLIQGSMRMRSDLGKRDDGGRITEADFVHKHGKWVDSFSQVTKEVIDALPLLLEAMDQVCFVCSSPQILQIIIAWLPQSN